MKIPLLLLAMLALAGRAFALAAAVQPTAEQLDFFEKKIRPVLADKCYKCHSEKAEKLRGGLLLDTREGAQRGGDSGPAVVPGELKESLLVDAIQYANKDTAMPPEKSGGKLPDAVIKDFETWIAMGAPDPRDGAAKVVKKDSGEARKWWAFQPVQKPAAAPVQDVAWPRGEIDRFVLAGLETREMKPGADADKLTLLRRIYFDLAGLPPAPREIEDFARDVAPDAFAKVVDRLLASPQFGERWGRHWLDVARYAESSGKDVNISFPQAWRYRDYVIGAFNADKPYDQFIREQIAGDLLPASDAKRRAEQAVATGFLAVGAKGLNERNPKQFALDVADEQIDTISQAVLGLTVACARCHDHKFDPIAQREYYGLAGILLSTETKYGTLPGLQNLHPGTLVELPAAAGLLSIKGTLSPERRTALESDLVAAKKRRDEMVGEGIKSRMAEREGKADTGNPAVRFVQIQAANGRVAQLEQELKSFDEKGQAKAFCMGAQDRPTQVAERGFGGMFGGRPRFGGGPEEMRKAIVERLAGGYGRQGGGFETIGDSPLFARGDVDKPGEKIPRSFPAVLTLAPAPPIPAKASGRKELAEWLTAPTNPLTARVMVNRMWHWLFGRGIVESVDNFGTMGQKPSDAALLDHLATRLVENGWSMKKTIREIVLSRTYQLASTFDAKNFASDPENTLLWRHDKRRLDAECIRDAMLMASAQLERTPQPGSLIARSGDGPIGGPRRMGIGEDAVIKANGNARSVYLPIARDVVPDVLAVFDFAEPSLVTGARESTNVPSQALYLLNSEFAAAQAQKLGERVVAAYPAGPNGGVTANLDQRVVLAYWITFGRAPDVVERRASTDFFSRFPSNYAKGDGATPGLLGAEAIKAAWTSFCRALFASAEFRYLN